MSLLFTEVTVYECYLKCNLYIHVPIIGRALKMTSVFLYFCLLEINQEEKIFVWICFFSFGSIFRKALRPSSGIYSRAALAAESSSYIIINSSARWKTWHSSDSHSCIITQKEGNEVWAVSSLHLFLCL